MTKQEEAEAFAASAPELTQEDLDSINALFPTYIFRRSKTRELWTTCCRRYERLPWHELTDAEFFVMAALHQREPHWNEAEPKGEVCCPWCGKTAIVKELGRTGQRQNLFRCRRAMVLHWDGGALWGTAWDCYKGYEHQLINPPVCRLLGVYRFQQGLAEAVVRNWYDYPFIGINRQAGPLTGGRWKIPNPFTCNSEYGVGYDVINLDELQKTPFRYCGTGRTEYFHRFLTACCFYPRQIEMLMKAGMSDAVRDLTDRGVKNARAIDWTKTDPVEAFGLSKQDLKAFLGTSRNIRTIELCKRLKFRASIEECAEWAEKITEIQSFISASKKWNLPPERLLRYLARWTSNGYINTTLHYWSDYLSAAEALGMPIYRNDVLLPEDLNKAHDDATSLQRQRLEQQRKLDEAEKAKLRAAAYAERREKLEKKYSYAADGIVIRVPGNEEEILTEGRELQHCVGGYAARHIEGQVTILFMRQAKSPDKPWLTIEMNGNSLVQIHGYRNEGLYTSKGRFAPDPREKHRAFLEGWLAWLKRGSPRRKDGTPKISKKKGQAA